MRSHAHLHRPQDTNNLGSTPPSSGTAAPAQGVWVIDVNASESTSITQVGLPCYDRANPLTGTKDARESHLKLMTGMNADVRPLNFRSEWDDREGQARPLLQGRARLDLAVGRPATPSCCARRRTSPR